MIHKSWQWLSGGSSSSDYLVKEVTREEGKVDLVRGWQQPDPLEGCKLGKQTVAKTFKRGGVTDTLLLEGDLTAHDLGQVCLVSGASQALFLLGKVKIVSRNNSPNRKIKRAQINESFLRLYFKRAGKDQAWMKQKNSLFQCTMLAESNRLWAQ